MSPQRWQRVEEVLVQCLDCALEQRAGVLEQLCGPDEELRKEVESLVAAHSAAERFQPVAGFVRPLLEALETEYFLGRTLGRYRIESFVGRGATGSVYRAVDTESGSTVALKIVAPELISSPKAIEATKRRIEEWGKVRHANVARINGLETEDGVAWIVMEFVDGGTLSAERTRAWEGFRVAWQLAEALRALHVAGIAHGDVRAANVMLNRRGALKLVDPGHAATGNAQSDWAQYGALCWELLRPGRRAVLIGITAAVVAIAAMAWTHRPVSKPVGWAQLTSDAGYTTDPALSADGKLLAFASDREGPASGLDIWLQPYPGGPPRRLTLDDGDESNPSFSPDGKWVAFRSDRGKGGIYRCPTTGACEPELMVAEGKHPQYSPDGKWLAYILGSDDDRDGARFYLLAMSEGRTVQVGAGFERVVQPVWSPDSGRILLSARKANERRYGLWIASVKTGELSPVELPENLVVSGVRVEPRRLAPQSWRDNRLLFTHFLGGTTALIEVGIVGNALVHPLRVIYSSTDVIGEAVRTKEGSLIYGATIRSTDLWAQPVGQDFEAAGPLTPLTRTIHTQVVHPSLSSDERSLIVSYWNPFGTAIMRQSADGTFALFKRMPGRSWGLLAGSGGDDVYYEDRGFAGQVSSYSADSDKAKWAMPVTTAPWDVSPDRRTVLVSSGTRQEKVVAMQRNGEQRVVVDAAAHAATDAHFSPDGGWIAFTSGGRLYAVPFPAGTPRIQLTRMPGLLAEWAPSGRVVYFLSKADGFTCLWVQRLDAATKRPDGEATPVRHFHRRTLSADNLPIRDSRFAVGPTRVILSLQRLQGNLMLATN